MKFIAKRGAPDIPLEILEAQESGQLVFFCGAGVSYPAGLPSFPGLVNDVYTSLLADKEPLEEEAIKGGFYDRALGLLESRVRSNNSDKPNQLRRAIIERLNIADGADLSTHKAILDLSKTEKKNYRLVTTNVDKGFLFANPSLDLQVDMAPKLPVPKPHKWESVVHLHGIIDTQNDPNGDHLVFTSGDFGSAYLTERWASKFVTELFSHFTVLFVGYSINDPVLRYMTDAISAERRVGYNKFNQPYILAKSTPKELEADTIIWKAKGVEPILYTYGHLNLHNTLKHWAAYARDGLNGKERIIKTKARIPPVLPYDNDESVRQVIDTLREKTNNSKEDVSGHPARIFSELEDPPAPIEWLPILDEEGLLCLSDKYDSVHPVTFSPIQENLKHPNPISISLWVWISKHLESKYLVEWIISRGICLHPKLEELIEWTIDRSAPQEPYNTFWRILLSGYTGCWRRNRVENYGFVEKLDEYKDILGFKHLLDMFEPVVNLSKPINFFDYEEGAKAENEGIFEAKIDIGMSEYLYQELKKQKSYPGNIIELLLPTTTSLEKVMSLWELVGYADKTSDRSYWDLPSISAHPQNRTYNSWVLLIEICRDLWESASRSNPELAILCLALWKTIKYPVFRRLVLHAYTVSDLGEPEETFHYLLSDEGWWLWSVVTQREKFRLLEKLWPVLSESSCRKLIEVVLKGPPRKMYRDDIEDTRLTYRKDREKWHILEKLSGFRRHLPIDAKNELDRIRATYVTWKLSDNERDEFAHWTETRVGNEADLSMEDLFQLPIPSMLDRLLDVENNYHEGRIDLFRYGVRGNSERVVEILGYISENQISAKSIWHAALVGLADLENKYWSDVSNFLCQESKELYSQEAWAIAWWTRKAVEEVEPYTDEEEKFWKITNLILDNVDGEYAFDNDDIISAAINDPVGISTESLLERLDKLKIKVGERISQNSHLNMINRIISDKRPRFFLGKAILASRLHYFYAVDPEWTKAYLLPKFDWDVSEDAKYYWDGFLWIPRITAGLALELREYLTQALKNSDELGKNSERVYQLFILVCLEYQELYKPDVQRKVMGSIDVEGLVEVSDFLLGHVKDIHESSDEYWENRIKPFIKRAWPKVSVFTNARISTNFSLLALNMEHSFTDVFDVIKPFIVPVDDLRTIIFKMRESKLLEKHPTEMFELLMLVFSSEYKWPNEKLREVVDKIVELVPEIIEEPDYRKIDDYLIRNRL